MNWYGYDDDHVEQLPAWMRFLPRQDLLVMLQELRTCPPGERLQVLEDWEVTARALIDQDAREVLLGEPAQAVGGSVPYPYEEQRLLLQAALRCLSAEHGAASDPPADAEFAEDMLEEAALRYAHAVARYRVGKS